MTSHRSKTTMDFEEDSVVMGTVKELTGFGAFIDIGGYEALLHKEDMAWSHVYSVTDYVKIDQRLEVVIIKINHHKDQITLGLKQLRPNPWLTAQITCVPGSRHTGKVSCIRPGGIFLRLNDDMQAYVKTSDLTWQRKVRDPKMLVQLGSTLTVDIVKCDVDKRTIQATHKPYIAHPWFEFVQKHKPGHRLEGTITSVRDYGVFVDLGQGMQGLLHQSQLSVGWKKTFESQKGDRLSVNIFEIHHDTQRVNLRLE